MELIDRRKLVSDFWEGVEDCAILSYEDTDALMENAPTVDAVEVIRCKDCASGKGSTHKVCPLYNQGLMKDDDFCSKGERKDNA